MAKLYESPCGDLVITRYRGGITADHVLRPSVHLNAACIQIAFDLVPIGRLAQVGQQMAQPVIAKIQWLDDLGGQLAQRVVHAREIGFHRHVPVVAFREDRGQPNDRRPPPADPRCVQWRGIGRSKTSGKPIVTICPMRSATSSTRSVMMTSSLFPRSSAAWGLSGILMVCHPL